MCFYHTFGWFPALHTLERFHCKKTVDVTDVVLTSAAAVLWWKRNNLSLSACYMVWIETTFVPRIRSSASHFYIPFLVLSREVLVLVYWNACRIWLPHYEVVGSAHHHPGNVKEAQNRTNHSSLSKLSLAILPNIQQHSECQTTVWIVNLLQINEIRCEHSQNQHVTWNWYCVTIQCKTFAQCLATLCLVALSTILAMPKECKVEYLSRFQMVFSCVFLWFIPSSDRFVCSCVRPKVKAKQSLSIGLLHGLNWNHIPSENPFKCIPLLHPFSCAF